MAAAVLLSAREKLGRALRGIVLRRYVPPVVIFLGFGGVEWWLFHRPFGFLLALLAFVPLLAHLCVLKPCFFPGREHREAVLRLLVHWQSPEGNGFHLVWADEDCWFVPEGIGLTEEKMIGLLQRAGLDGFAVEKKNAFYRGGWERERREARSA